MTTITPPAPCPFRPRRERAGGRWGDLGETVALAWGSLLANRLRSGLTMLGVIIGIAAVITMITIGRGAQAQTEAQLKRLGSNLLYVQRGEASTGSPASQGAGTATTLVWDDARAIAESCGAVAAVAPSLTGRAQVSHGAENFSTTINGTTPEFTRVRDFLPLTGRFFNQAELDKAARVAVLGQTVVDELALTPATAVGSSVRIRGEAFAVIGTMEYKGTTGPRDQDDVVLVPLTTMAARIAGVNAIAGISVDSIAVLARSEGEMEAAQFQITNLLRLRHRILPPRQDDFRVRNQADILSAFNAVANTITLMLGGSAAISLVVGGIGIMNIMLVSVTERTREIGVRRAIGARSGDILRQFLIEGVVLTLCGGLVGIALGVGVSTALTRSFGWSVGVGLDAVLLALLFCLAIGVFFGAYPARKAARLDPITALRSE